MNGHENLIPCNKRSKDEARELGRKGGIKSGQTRRRNADFKKLAKAYLPSIPPEHIAEQLRQQGIEDENVTMAMAIFYAMSAKAVKGDVSAANWIVKQSGQNADDKIKLEELKIRKAELELKKRELELKAKAKDETESTPSIVEQIGELLNQNRLNKND